ncbi:type I-MYXAN CRISPR-associated Cas8a1/Cmx1 [Nostoc sp.]|uniref:type I-MYXAN CRISPR-associated Cas8a1/Cmx1 n=1 Tax=Nostoc sp. TaxID=1180 RepID=UPI002FF9450C
MSVVTSVVNPKIRLNLGDPSITWIHRVGIAGLWMTLKQLEKLYPILTERPGNLTWLLTPRSISLQWQGQDFIVLDWLLKQSFQINEEGLISLTGINTHLINIETQINIHLGITGTFLQHNQIFKFDGEKSRVLIVDGMEIDVEYKKAVSYAHQHFAKQLCDKQGQLLRQSIGVAGWLYPGSVVRHVAFTKETKFAEKPQLAFALLYAPVACHYFVLRSHTQPQHPQYAVVIPEVTNLEIYAQQYWNLGNLDYKHFHVSSLGDAALRFLTYKTTIELAIPDQVKRCQVILFGTVVWSKRQKTRTEIAVVEATEIIDIIYKLSCISFSNYRIIKYENTNFIISNVLKGIIADNLVKGFLWWNNLYIKIRNVNLLKLILSEDRGIYEMIEHSQWDIKAQKLFIQACHEALKKIYAKIYNRTKEGQYAQIERENIRILSQLGRCTNLENFRKFIAEFWGKAGQLSILEEHWEELLPLTSGIMDWKVARDLTFIAIASYPKNKNTNKKILEKSDLDNE